VITTAKKAVFRWQRKAAEQRERSRIPGLKEGVAMPDEKNVSRRDFLKIAGVTGAVVGVGGGTGGLLAGCGSGTTTTTAATTATTAAAGGATTTTAAAETTTSAAVAAAGGTLSVDIGDPSFIDPAVAFESEGIQVDQAVFDRLCKFNFKTNDIEPSVAKSWETSSDGLTWTFHLNQGTKFHNGREVVAADFKYGWERLTDPTNKSNYQTLLGMVKGYDEMTNSAAKELSGVVATDSYTLTVTLTSPFSVFPMICAMAQTAPERRSGQGSQGIRGQAHRQRPVHAVRAVEPRPVRQSGQIPRLHGHQAEHRRHRLQDLQRRRDRLHRLPG
jgi:hypothetical protein